PACQNTLYGDGVHCDVSEANSQCGQTGLVCLQDTGAFADNSQCHDYKCMFLPCSPDNAGFCQRALGENYHCTLDDDIHQMDGSINECSTVTPNTWYATGNEHYNPWSLSEPNLWHFPDVWNGPPASDLFQRDFICQKWCHDDNDCACHRPGQCAVQDFC